MPNIDQTPVIILASLTAVFFALFIYQLIENYRLKRRPQDVLEKAQDKSYQLLSQAIKKAENIISVAELQGLKITTQNKLNSQDIENKYSAVMESITKKSSEDVSSTAVVAQQEIIKAQDSFMQYIESLAEQSDTTTKANQEAIRQKINKLFEVFEQGLSNFLTETQQQSVKAIDLELQASRQLIQTYKQEQFKMIDENIVAMLERTLALVLTKKLTLKDQVQIVYESLEKAKAEKFFV